MSAGSFLDLLSRLIRIASYVAILFIAAGLIGLLTDEVSDTSKVEATRIVDPGSGRTVTTTVDVAQPNPPAAIEKIREQEHSGAREAIDDAGDVMMAPFTFLIKDSDGAVRRLLYSGIALI